MTTRLAALHAICLDIAGQPLSTRLQTLAQFFLGTTYGFWPDGSSLESLDDFDYSLDTPACLGFVIPVIKVFAVDRPEKAGKIWRGYFSKAGFRDGYIFSRLGYSHYIRDG